eukprot:1190687-Prorocentrum_minimum.AAC.2
MSELRKPTHQTASRLKFKGALKKNQQIDRVNSPPHREFDGGELRVGLGLFRHHHRLGQIELLHRPQHRHQAHPVQRGIHQGRRGGVLVRVRREADFLFRGGEVGVGDEVDQPLVD